MLTVSNLQQVDVTVECSASVPHRRVFDAIMGSALSPPQHSRFRPFELPLRIYYFCRSRPNPIRCAVVLNSIKGFPTPADCEAPNTNRLKITGPHPHSVPAVGT